MEVYGTKGKISTNRIFTAPKDFKCTISYEIEASKYNFQIEPEDQFIRMLKYFYELIAKRNSFSIFHESEQIKEQARLLDQIRIISKL